MSVHRSAMRATPLRSAAVVALALLHTRMTHAAGDWPAHTGANASGSGSMNTTLFWCVADVRPDETLLCALGGGEAAAGLSLTLRITPLSAGAPPCEATAQLSPTGGAVQAVIPASTPSGAYGVQLFSAGSPSRALSGMYTVNRPELWWAQGDRGEVLLPHVAAACGGHRVCVCVCTCQGVPWRARVCHGVPGCARVHWCVPWCAQLPVARCPLPVARCPLPMPMPVPAGPVRSCTEPSMHMPVLCCQTSTPGGWVRVFGRGLTLPMPPGAGEQHTGCAACELDTLTRALALAGRRGDWELAAALSARTAHLVARQHTADAAPATTLNLTSSGGRSFLLTASAQRLSTFSAEFTVPAGMPPGNYSAVLSNGQAAARLGWFHSPLLPARDFLEIRNPPASNPPVFMVSDYGCAGGLNRTDPKDLASAEPVDCTAAAARALAAAAKLSPAPSTVLFGRGRWYLHPPLLIPDGVTIAGDSMGTTALYFSQTSINGSFTTHAGIPALIGPAEPSARAAGGATTAAATTFGVTDMCIYALSFYSAVINISTATTNVQVKRVRIRANAFNGRNAGPDRSVPWQATIGANGPPVILLQGTSAEVSGCDIYATWVAIASHGHYGLAKQQC